MFIVLFLRSIIGSTTLNLAILHLEKGYLKVEGKYRNTVCKVTNVQFKDKFSTTSARSLRPMSRC